MRLTAAAALLAAIGFSAQAADLGTLSVTSRLNEPLSARLTVNNVDPKVEPLVVRLAPEATYDRIGKKPLAADTGLELTLESKSPWVVRIKSEKPVTSRDFPLIVELNDGGKLSAKYYRIRLEPAVAPAPAAAPMATAQAQTKQAAPSAGKLPSTAAMPSVETKKAEPAAKPAPAKRETVKAKPQVKPASAKTTTNKPQYTLADPIIVKPGMTMWSIANLLVPRYEGARTEEVLVALIRRNPAAFKNGRISGLKPGARLKEPTQAQVDAVGTDVAWCLVHVTPNADMRKAPSARNLNRAHQRMKQARIAWTPKKPAAEVQKPAVKPAEPMKPATPEAKPETAAPAAAAAAAAATAAATTEALTPAAAPEETKPAQTQATKTEPAADTQPEMTAQPAVEEKTEEEGSSAWLWGLLIILIAAAAGGWFVWRRKKEKEEFERTERTIRFLRPEPTTPQQVRNMDELLTKRMEADAAAKRGFDAAPAATATATAAAAATVTASETKAPETAAPQPAAEVRPEVKAQAPEEEPRPFTLTSTSSGMQIQPPEAFSAETPVTAEDGHSPEAMAVKLTAAQQKIDAGFPDDAEKLLREVKLFGTDEQRAAAERLLDAVRRV